MGIKCRSQPQHSTMPGKKTYRFVLFKGRLLGKGLSNALTVITMSMQHTKVLSLTGKPCGIKAYRMLYIRILTVKPNSCGQEKKKNTMSAPNQDLDVYRTDQVYVVHCQKYFGLLLHSKMTAYLL